MRKKPPLDHEEKIHYLTLIIKSLCDENSINTNVVIEDFIYIMDESLSDSLARNNINKKVFQLLNKIEEMDAYNLELRREVSRLKTWIGFIKYKMGIT